MKTSNHIERFRRKDLLDSGEGMGMNGIFSIPLPDRKSTANCIVCCGEKDSPMVGMDWEHVSAHIMERQAMGTVQKTPNWEQMCFIKETFWKDDEVVIQIHPAKKDYVNIHQHVLHLWRPVDGILRTPPAICV